MRIYSKLACFIGGVLFGSVGIKLLNEKRAAKEAEEKAAAEIADENDEENKEPEE